VSNNISVPVDVTNPGQFFACCGLLELAARLWPQTRGHFDNDEFHMGVPHGATLPRLLQAFSDCPIDGQTGAEDDESDGEDDDGAGPIVLRAPINLTLDWWNDRSLKPWAGSMDAVLIFQAMRAAIDPEQTSPFNDLRVVYDAPDPSSRSGRPKKREPFYFDARRGGSAKSLEIGFAPDAFGMTSATCPAVESLSLVGLQRFRPRPTGLPREFDYLAWSDPMPPILAAPAVCGLLSVVAGERCRFENGFRTDQRKHKGFLPARRITQGDRK